MEHKPIERIRQALAAGPTEGPWLIWEKAAGPSQVVAAPAAFVAQTVGGNDDANANYITACSPDAIRSLLSRLDELEKDAARYRWLRDEESAHHRAWEKLTALDCVEEEFDSIVDAAIDSAIAKGA